MTEIAPTPTEGPYPMYPTPVPPPTETPRPLLVYNDPDGRYSIKYPMDWKPLTGGGFGGPDGSRVYFLPEMGHYTKVWRVCEALANLPEGPEFKPIRSYEVSEGSTRECSLTPLNEQDPIKHIFIIENPTTNPEYHYQALELRTEDGERIIFEFPNKVTATPQSVADPSPATHVKWKGMEIDEYPVATIVSERPGSREPFIRPLDNILDKHRQMRQQGWGNNEEYNYSYNSCPITFNGKFLVDSEIATYQSNKPKCNEEI